MNTDCVRLRGCMQRDVDNTFLFVINSIEVLGSSDYDFRATVGI